MTNSILAEVCGTSTADIWTALLLALSFFGIAALAWALR